MSDDDKRNADARPVVEAELHAYVDGRLDAARHGAVEAWLAGHPDQAARLADWRSDGQALRDHFDPVLDEPIPAALAGPGARRWAPWAGRVAAAALLIGLGAAGGWFGRGLERGGEGRGSEVALVHGAAVAHRVYTVEVRHPVEVGADEQAHLTAWLGKRLGSALAAPNLASQGFQLVGGRLLTGGDGPAALLMYQREDGKRITLYIVATGQKERTDLAYAGNAGVGTLYWKDGDLAWALSGEIDRDKLARLAHLAYGQSKP